MKKLIIGILVASILLVFSLAVFAVVGDEPPANIDTGDELLIGGTGGAECEGDNCVVACWKVYPTNWKYEEGWDCDPCPPTCPPTYYKTGNNYRYIQVAVGVLPFVSVTLNNKWVGWCICDTEQERTYYQGNYTTDPPPFIFSISSNLSDLTIQFQYVDPFYKRFPTPADQTQKLETWWSYRIFKKGESAEWGNWIQQTGFGTGGLNAEIVNVPGPCCYQFELRTKFKVPIHTKPAIYADYFLVWFKTPVFENMCGGRPGGWPWAPCVDMQQLY